MLSIVLNETWHWIRLSCAAAYCIFYGNFFILFLLKQMKFKVVKGFVSQVLYEIENNLFAIRLIIGRIPEFQGSQQNLVKCLKFITELQLSHSPSFGCGRGINCLRADVSYFLCCTRKTTTRVQQRKKETSARRQGINDVDCISKKWKF